jgi:ribosomal 50S subunit-recycling heat shock protein
MQSSPEKLSSARNSCGVTMSAPMAYQRWKSVKRALSLASRPVEAAAWLTAARACVLRSLVADEPCAQGAQVEQQCCRISRTIESDNQLDVSKVRKTVPKVPRPSCRRADAQLGGARHVVNGQLNEPGRTMTGPAGQRSCRG